MTTPALAPLSPVDLDRVSASMGNYVLKGWTILNDGCPDCQAPLMRNQEGNMQICVQCDIFPPLDPEDPLQVQAHAQHHHLHHHDHHQDELDLHLDRFEDEPTFPPVPTTLPSTSNAPSTALPGVPAGPRSLSATTSRASVLDPAMLDMTRKALRGPSGRILTPSSPPPRSSTPLPTRSISGPLLVGRTPLLPPPRPSGPPPALPSSPPPSASVGQLPIVPRDMKRSPQSSIILPPSTPPPARPTPPSSRPIPSLPTKTTSTVPPLTPTPAAIHPNTTVRVPDQGSDAEANIMIATATEGQPAAAAAGTGTPVKTMSEGEKEDDKDLESHDEFEDAHEEVLYKATEEEIRTREAKSAQSDRASKLIGQRMLQGWAMMQDPCPNQGCNGVPLIRNRETKEYCVLCESYFQRHQDHDSTKTTLVPIPKAIPPPTPTPRATSQLQHPSRSTSPLTSPTLHRTRSDLHGRISSSIILPPAAPMSPSFGMTSHQILNSRHLSEDMDKLASDDEETKRHIQVIGKVGEFSSRSLPPVPPVPASHYHHSGPGSGPGSHAGSRPTSTYSNSSGYTPSEKERERPPRHHNHHSTHANTTTTSSSSGAGSAGPSPPPVPPSPEVQAIIAATHKTMATVLVKLELYRLALEVSENPKECHALTLQIKGLMECLKACRDNL